MKALGAQGSWYRLLSDSLEQSEGGFSSEPSEAVAYEDRDASEALEDESCWLKENVIPSKGVWVLSSCKADRRGGVVFLSFLIGKLWYNLENLLEHASSC